jgi:hypothetical protein
LERFNSSNGLGEFVAGEDAFSIENAQVVCCSSGAFSVIATATRGNHVSVGIVSLRARNHVFKNIVVLVKLR